MEEYNAKKCITSPPPDPYVPFFSQKIDNYPHPPKPTTYKLPSNPSPHEAIHRQMHRQAAHQSPLRGVQQSPSHQTTPHRAHQQPPPPLPAPRKLKDGASPGNKDGCENPGIFIVSSNI